jgi:hypothetical protein
MIAHGNTCPMDPVRAHAPLVPVTPEDEEFVVACRVPAVLEKLRNLLNEMFVNSHAGKQRRSRRVLRQFHADSLWLANAALELMDELEAHMERLHEFYESAAEDEEVDSVCSTCDGCGIARQRSFEHGPIPCPDCRSRGSVRRKRPIGEIAESLKPLDKQIERRKKARRLARGLGQTQRHFLKQLLRARADRGQGASIKHLRGDSPKTTSNRATFSRMLRSLEMRRLIVRTNWQTGIPGQGIIRTELSEPKVARTSHVILTRLGKDVAALREG